MNTTTNLHACVYAYMHEVIHRNIDVDWKRGHVWTAEERNPMRNTVLPMFVDPRNQSQALALLSTQSVVRVRGHEGAALA